MKKVSLLAILATISSGSIVSAAEMAPGCPKAFQGFHLGGNIGYGVGVGDKKHSVNSGTGGSLSHKTDLGFNGVDGGIGVGYTHRFGNWGLGLVFDANWSNTDGTAKKTDQTSFYASETVKVRLRNSLQLYARAGYVIGGMAMPFVGLGWDNSAWKQSFTQNFGGVNPTFSKSKSKRFNALLWKAGVDFLATKHVVVGFEYTGTMAQRKKASGTDAAGNTYSSSFRPQYNKFALTAKIVY